MPEVASIYYSLHEGGQIDLPPVVLIHGAGGTHLNWPVEMRRMSGQRILAVDLPGHGQSRGFAQQFIPAYADQLHALLSELGLPEAVLVGHSMGGAIALAMALKYPARVAGLGLIATGAYLGIDAEIISNLSNSVTVPAGLQRLQQRAFSPSTSTTLIEACMRPLREIRPSLLLADWLACSTFDLREMIGQIQAPAWVVCGADDRITPVAYSHFLASHLSGSQMQIIPNAGHMVVLEQPGPVTQGLCNFLNIQLPAIQSYRWNLQRQTQPVKPDHEA